MVKEIRNTPRSKVTNVFIPERVTSLGDNDTACFCHIIHFHKKQLRTRVACNDTRILPLDFCKVSDMHVDMVYSCVRPITHLLFRTIRIHLHGFCKVA
jgi:hypothetical protein